ncbi:vWA domain-containing protein [Leuconostoc carnosum]|uniref:vWA domain-containing protein n=1 Tax=Leuconostoc carnosum TaxID=1252 RepID=UPI00345D2939
MNAEDRDKLIVDGIKTLLDVAPLYGNVIMNLTRENNDTASNALSLKWQANQWHLVINPILLTTYFINHTQIALAFAHEALHVIWQHPIRYADERVKSPNLIDWGTDLAVNQYLPIALGMLPGAVTLQTILGLYGKMLPIEQDSAEYIALLSELTENQPARGQKPVDGHGDWASAGQGIDEATSALNFVIEKATEDTNRSGRGDIAAAVLKQIASVTVPKRHWQAILRTGISQLPTKKKASHSRFNRRQAYRLDLPGSVSEYEAQVTVFIDNSASISDHQAGVMLANARQIIQQFDVEVTFFSFDTTVHEIKNIKQWQRQAGGGTQFQSIFDTLKVRKFNPKHTVVVILTDGDGEETVLSTKFRQVYWLLLSDHKLSILEPFGKIMTL